MDAIKKVLHPGHKHHDETTDSSTAGQTGTTSTGAPHEEHHRARTGSVFDQIVNPEHEKYNAERFQGDESADGGVRHATTENTVPEQKHHAHTGGVLDQIVNPGHEKYDAARFQGQDTSSSDYSAGTGKKEHNVLRQILNPGGEKYDPVRYGTAESTSSAAPVSGALATGSNAQQITSQETATNDHSILRQLANPGGEKYDPTRYAETGTVGSGTQSSAQTSATGGYSSTTGPSSTQSHAHDQSHQDRNAALAGATGLGAGALASESAKHHDETRGTSSGTTDRSALTGGSASTTAGNTGYNTSSNAPAASSYSTSSANPPAASSYSTSTNPTTSSTTNPTGASSYNTTSSVPSTGTQSQSHHGAEAALGGAALGAGGVAAYEHNKHAPSSTTGPYDSSRSAVPQSSTGAYQSTPTTSQTGYQSTPATAQSGYGSAPSTTSQTGYGSAPSSTSQSGYGTAATAGTGAAVGAGAAAYGQQGPTSQQSGLSHHVHNKVTEVPSTSGRHDIGTTSHSTQSSEPQSTSHSSFPSATETAAAAGAGTGLSHHVYNGLTGKGGAHEPEHHHSAQDSSATTGSASGTDRSVSGGTAGYGQSSSTSQYSSGVGAASTGPSSTSQYSSGIETTGQPSSTSQYAGTQSSSTNPALIAAQQAARGQGNTSLPDRSVGQSTGQSEHHYGRDAALAGGAGAVGAGAYEAGKQSGTGPASKTIGPHDSNIANVLDPRVQPNADLQKSSTTTGPHQSDTLNKLDPRVDSSATGTQSHAGRDAALAGGAGAAVGAGAYEAGKHHDAADTGYGSSGQQPSSTGLGSTDQSSSTGYGSTGLSSNTGYGSAGQHATGQTTTSQQYTGPVHDSAVLNKLDPRVKPVDNAATDSQSHTGRNAALAGGAGAATGAGVYEAEKHHSSHQPSSQYSSGANPQSTSTSTQPSSYSQSTAPTGASQSYQQPQQQSHTGRDTALGAGSGAATGAGIYEAGKHHDQSSLASNTGATGTSGQGYGSSTGPAPNTIGPHSSDAANVLDPRVQPNPALQSQQTTAGTSASTRAAGQEYGSGTGPAPNTIGPHSSDAANVLDPRVQPDPVAQSKHNTSGTSTAAGTGAAAGAASDGSHHSSHHGPQVREDENHHNKLHKEPKEKKEGFLHKIFHHGDKHDKHDPSAQHSGTSSTTGTGSTTGEKQIDPHTGLPIDTSLGSGAGGTDGNPAIGGFQADAARH